MGMASSTVHEFLESSTIHGLSYISRAKSHVAKASWVAIVVACFSIAMYMITNSYKEWQESPVSATITTHPISDLDFPTVTVCPPRGSDTVLNHLLAKVKEISFTNEERDKLVNISREVFIEIPNKNLQGQKVSDQLLSLDNMTSIVKGKAKMPDIDNDGMITLESSELEGSFSTPGYNDSKYQGKFYNKPQSLHYVLRFPENLQDMVGEGALVISVQTRDSWTFKSAEKSFQFHKALMNWNEAENYCVSQRGHLASIASQEQNEEVLNVASKVHAMYIWLGGKRKPFEEWFWSDNLTWSFHNWRYNPYYHEGNCMVIMTQHSAGKWDTEDCSNERDLICSNPPQRKSGDKTFVFRNHSLRNPTFQFW